MVAQTVGVLALGAYIARLAYDTWDINVPVELEFLKREGSECRFKSLFQAIAMVTGLAVLQYKLEQPVVNYSVAWLLIVAMAYPCQQHLNPSVSVSFYSAGVISARTCIAKLFNQFLAAALCGFLLAGLPKDFHRIDINGRGIAAPGPFAPKDGLKSFAVEAAASAGMVLVVLVASRVFAKQPTKHAEAATVATLVLALGHATKASTDPAGALAAALFTRMKSDKFTPFAINFVLASLVGAAIGGLVFRLLLAGRLPEPPPPPPPPPTASGSAAKKKSTPAAAEKKPAKAPKASPAKKKASPAPVARAAASPAKARGKSPATKSPAAKSPAAKRSASRGRSTPKA
jgi:glycerol uptake facilitator-like aquaporin